jgi:hypothetical protein
MTTTADTSSPPSTASKLWAHLLHRYPGPSNPNATQLASHPQLTPQDKAGTSTRILLHDTHARLEKFSDRANSIFSELEASRREMVRVREEVENAREKEFEEMAQLSASIFFFASICCLIASSSASVSVSRCQSSLQKAIGDPIQAHQAIAMQAGLTLTSERLHALEDKTNSRLDALTTVQCNPDAFRREKRKYQKIVIIFFLPTQLLQTQTQLSQSLQEQFSRAQNQQSRILELLAPLHPTLRSVPLHIDIARNAIMEKISEGCRCFHNRSDSSSPLAVPSSTPPSESEENAELPFATRKKRRISVDTSQPNPRQLPMRNCHDRPIAVEDECQLPQGLVQRPGPEETQTAAQSRQTPRSEKGDNDSSGVICRYLADVQSGSRGAATLATTLSTTSRTPFNESIGRKGIAPSVTAPRIRAYGTQTNKMPLSLLG